MVDVDAAGIYPLESLAIDRLQAYFFEKGEACIIQFILKRLGQSVFIFVAVSVLVFAMVRVAGVDPVSTILSGGKATSETIASVRHKFFLDRSYPEQYLFWMGNLLRGDPGVSYKFLQPVGDLLKGRLLVTLGLISMSVTMMLALSVSTGIWTAVKHNGWEDRVLSLIGLFFLSTPAFLMGILMIVVISAVAPGISFAGAFSTPAEFLQRLLLPSVALALSMYAVVSRMIRSNMVEQLQSEYILAATARGLSPLRIVFRHALKNAMIPVITVLGIQIGALLSGTVLVENVFALPGIGSLLLDSINASDYAVVQSLTLLFVAAFLLLNLICDILYAVIDPRIRLEG